ncbi:TonB-dependent receptor [Sphingomonas crocodyli]|uniref:TonB-dependent receptor n=1 Tax=Sphingomonas crocodyli TaxID=1979270 RepID=A0A437M8D0_9SPHN|nr:TonB-dependent receptor [Sphingomonas crocodyli]RVT93863.1 TonB-dependent receptor [Sphingomonas crocodyli]
MSIFTRRLLATIALLPAWQMAQAADADDGAILVVGQTDKAITVEPRGLSVSLGDKQFAGVNAFNVEDLIKYAPDFFVRTRFIGDNNAVPGFRGTHSTQSARALVMIDGFTVSNFLGNSFGFPPAWGVVSPTEVSQFDVVYGPYSARYPGNSMGGIVNITTRAPEKTEAFGTVQGFMQPYRQYATRDTLFGGAAEFGFGVKQAEGPFSARVSARRLLNAGQPQQYYQLGAVTTGTATPISGGVVDPDLITKTPVAGDYANSDTRQDQVRGQIRYDRGDMHVELLGTYWWNREKTLNPRTYLRDAAGNPFYGSTANGGRVSLNGTTYTLPAASTFNLSIADRDQWLAGLKIEAPVAGFTVKANLSTLRFAQADTRRSNGYANGVANGAGQLTRQGPTGWYTGDILITRDVGAHDIGFGLNANRYDTEQTVFGTTNWRAATGRTFRSQTFGRTRLIGVFAEDEVDLGGGVTITPGIRADFWRAFGGGLSSVATTGTQAGQIVTQTYAPRKDSSVDPKLSARWAIDADWAAELSLATATRFPTVGELFQGSLNGDGSFNVNSFDPNLKAERSRDANFLLRRHLGPVTLTGSVFYQRVKNAIFSYVGFNQNGVSTSNFKNIDVTRQWGVELIAATKDWPIEGIAIDANAAMIDAETVRNRASPSSEGVQFPRIPRWRINGNIRYDLTPKLQGALGFRYASRPNTDLDGLQRGDTYGYTSELMQIDARLNWRLRDGLRLSAGVNNLTNDKAWVFHPYPQRTFTIEAGWTL